MKIREGCSEEKVGGGIQKQGTDKKGSKRKTILLKGLNFVLLFSHLSLPVPRTYNTFCNMLITCIAHILVSVSDPRCQEWSSTTIPGKCD